MLEATPLLTSAAAVPVIALVVLLIGFRWTAVRASAIGVALSAAVAFLPFRAPAEHIALDALRGLWNSVPIIIVIFPAILIYEISLQAGAFPAIRHGLTRLVPNRLLQLLALGWGFASFLQGPSGFGVPIAVTAPLLIAIGVKPGWAVTIPLVGHGWANTFGTLALAWDALLQQADLTAAVRLSAAFWAGLFLFAMNVLAGFSICWFYGGVRGVRQGLPAIAAFGLIMGGGQMALTGVLPPLATVIPTTVALGLAFPLARLPRYAGNSGDGSPIMESETPGEPAGTVAMGLHQAMLPYYALTAISFFVLLSGPVKSALERFTTGFAFPESATGLNFVSEGSDYYSPIAWLTHSGVFLLLSAAAAGWYYLAKGLLSGDGVRKAGAATLKKAIPASLSVILLIGMSRIMGGSGQTAVLAVSAADMTGSWYGALSPLIGVLGSFMSSSNVSSNILFGKFQCVTASLTGFDVAVILAAQTGGGALGCMISPAKVMLGATTAGVVGQDGVIIRRLLGVSVASAAVIGVLVMAFG
ncbi:MAG: L-lactate permease [Planctomycetota bacterium]|jgi:lactate permease|nr:L-lactate permease [Planctomycetota bacterium]